MSRSFDTRVIRSEVLEWVRGMQAAVECRVSGGSALSGVHLRHRRSEDITLVCKERESVRTLTRDLPRFAAGAEVRLVRDEGSVVAAVASWGPHTMGLHLMHDSGEPLAPPERVEGILVDSFDDLRASRVLSLLSRAEPRDLVDVMFLERAGFQLEDDLALAMRCDAGVDPGALAWLLHAFPTEPLPHMLAPLTPEELIQYRDGLAMRLQALALAPSHR